MRPTVGQVKPLVLRKKRWAPRARTGCVTCRQRRIKCDEIKPVCSRCRLSGLQCLGTGYGPYAVPLRTTNAQSITTPLLMQPLHVSTPFAEIPQMNERHMLHIFREQVVPGLLDVFDADFWSVTVPLAGQVYPAVWHALAATGTLKHMMLIKANNHELQAKGTERHHYASALRHCNMSLQFLRRIQPATATATDWEMLLLACLILIHYSILSGNFHEALTHIRGGFALANIWHYQCLNSSATDSKWRHSCVAAISSIKLRFQRLEVITFMGPFQLTKSSLKPLPAPELQPDLPFESSLAAYSELLRIDVAWKCLFRAELASGDTRLRFMVPEVRSLREPFQLWQAKYRALRRTMAPIDEDTSSGLCMEYVRRLVLQLLDLTLEAMIMVEPTRGQEAWDKFNGNFQGIVDYVAFILTPQRMVCIGPSRFDVANLLASMQFRSLLGMPLVAVAHLCRASTIRSRALALLRTMPFADGIIDSNFFVSVAERQQVIEEGGAQSSPLPQGCECTTDVFICRAHRVCELRMRLPNKGHGAKVECRTEYNVEHDTPGTTAIFWEPGET